MRLSCSGCCLLLSSLLFVLLKPSLSIKKSYVVYLGGHSNEEEMSEFYRNQVKELHYDFLASYVGSRDHAKDAILYSYTRHINGFAAILDEETAADISKHPNVITIFPNKGRKLHTTRSWMFLGLENNGVVPPDSIWKKAGFGEDVIIANLDTGVWPESKSFNDEGMGPIPAKWRGICQDDTKVGAVHCNRKLIGARYVNKGYLAALATANITNVTVVNSPRDEDGHGSHTLSTAGGAFVPRASVFNFGKGMAKGGAPRARVAAYKVCWPPINGSECFDADIVAAFDAALAEGIDVISAFLRGDPTPYFNDSISIGSFHAMMKGVPMVCSAGNSGPSYGTVSNLSPWILTVGASTMDREFANWVILGNNVHLKGQSLARTSLVAGKFYPLISAMSAKATNASSGEGQLCKAGTLDPKEVKGKILVCLRGDNARVDKGQQVALAGGVGMILANNQATGNEVIADPQVLPASHLNYTDGFAVFTYINSAKSLKAFITPMTTRLGTRPAPFMAAFSSRGPNAITPEILKPDITAPGVSVIAAYTKAQGPTNQLFDKRRVEFNSLTGTSMSCPHVAGIISLLRNIYPHWSPAALKSAIMTTARTEDNMWEPIPNASNMKANPFNYGAGHVQPNRAMDPGLVYDLDVNDYLHFLRGLGYNQSMIVLFSKGPYACPKNFAITDLTYPSITMPNLHGSITVTRTLKNVGSPGIYIARVQKPTGISVFVKPNVLKFDSIGQEKKFKLRLKVKKGNAPKDYVFGRLTRSDRVHHVSSPIVVEAV